VRIGVQEGRQGPARTWFVTTSVCQAPWSRSPSKSLSPPQLMASSVTSAWTWRVQSQHLGPSGSGARDVLFQALGPFWDVVVTLSPCVSHPLTGVMLPPTLQVSYVSHGSQVPCWHSVLDKACGLATKGRTLGHRSLGGSPGSVTSALPCRHLGRMDVPGCPPTGAGWGDPGQ
jgi:hypothetical protein